MEFLAAVVRAIRNLRTEVNCPPGKEIKVLFYGQTAELSLLSEQRAYLGALARVGSAEFLSSGERPRGAATAVIGTTEIYLPLDDLVNLDEEQSRLSKDVAKVEAELARVRRKLDNGDFLAKAKEEVVRKERAKANQFEEEIRTLRSSLEKIREIQAGRS
jgi:valyl-tRNA synthetase